MKNIFHKSKINRKFWFYSLIGAIIFFLVFSKSGRSIIFITLFIVINVFATLYKRYFYFPIEFELISLGIVLCASVYGLGAGLAVAIIGGIAYTIYCTSFSPFTVPMLFGYILMAIFAAHVPIQNIVILGIIANLLHNLVVFSAYHLFFSYDIWKNLLYSVSNIVFNIVIFYNFGPLLVKIM